MSNGKTKAPENAEIAQSCGQTAPVTAVRKKRLQIRPEKTDGKIEEIRKKDKSG